MSAAVLYDADSAGVATVTLNRPRTHNALSDDLVDDLLTVLRRAQADAAVRCVIIASSRPESFSAGGDLRAHVKDDPLVQKHADKRRFPTLFTFMRGMGKPLIAAVGGHCLAGGLGLALACDLIVASAEARFGAPEIDIGLFPFVIMPLVARAVPAKPALQLMLLGEPIPAREAHRLGMINRVVAADELEGAARAWAERLAAKSPLLLRLGKDAFYRQEHLAFGDAEEFMLAQLMLAFSTDDLHEGVAAFLERRPPRWSGR